MKNEIHPIIAICAHLSPKIIWEKRITSHTKNGIEILYKPHVLCQRCQTKLKDDDPIAKFWIARELNKGEKSE